MGLRNSVSQVRNTGSQIHPPPGHGWRPGGKGLKRHSRRQFGAPARSPPTRMTESPLTHLHVHMTTAPPDEPPPDELNRTPENEETSGKDMPAPHGACMKNTQTEKPGKNRPRPGRGGASHLARASLRATITRAWEKHRFPTPTTRARVALTNTQERGSVPPALPKQRREDHGGPTMACQGHLRAAAQASPAPGRLSRRGTPDNLGAHISPHHPRN